MKEEPEVIKMINIKKIENNNNITDNLYYTHNFHFIDNSILHKKKLDIYHIY